ncbi:MAG: CrcB family protein [Gammaproteobacteria bacterium]|nr:CrcB family protein [Pseudomonadota bacterium]MCH9663739.1 CrcB family protein [Gammaproteobacteria bacterium]
MSSLLTAFYVGLGAVLGALCRHGIGVATGAMKMSWLGVLTVNFAGCFLAGAGVALLSKVHTPPAWVQPLLFVGFLGSLTTFSALAADSLEFALRSQVAAVLANIAANVLLCAVAVSSGYLLFRSN